MNVHEIVKTVIEFNRNNFEKSFSIINKINEQVETKSTELLENYTLIPEQGKQAIRQWTETVRNGRQVLRKFTVKGYQEIENYLSATQ